MTLFGRRVPMGLSLLVWLVLWELIGRLGLVRLIPPFTTVVAAGTEMAVGARFQNAMVVTLSAYALGMALALVVGIAAGVLMGRVRAAGEVLGMWVNIFESSPLTVVVPVLMAVVGFGQPTIVITVFLFSVWVIALDTQVGIRQVNPSLIEMARSFGASRLALYGKVLLLAALPEILAGIRLGLIRGVKGVVIGQLLISIIGVGELFEIYSRSFLMPQFWALIIVMFAFAFALAEVVARIERRIEYYAGSR